MFSVGTLLILTGGNQLLYELEKLVAILPRLLQLCSQIGQRLGYWRFDLEPIPQAIAVIGLDEPGDGLEEALEKRHCNMAKVARSIVMCG